MAFAEDRIVLRFPVMSDLHIMGKGQETSLKLDKAFEQIKKYGNIDAVFFPGDLTDFGMPEQMEEFRDIMERHFNLDQTKLLFAQGNHERYRHELLGAPFTVGEDFVRVFRGKVYEGATREEIAAGNHMVILKGVPFIMVNAHQYSGGVDYRKEDKEWLKKALCRAEAETAPNLPIFVCAHPMIVDTCYGSNYAGGDGSYWSSSQLYPILAEHPRVVYFSGHLHFPLQHEKDIWQKEFTAIGTSSVYFASLEAWDPDDESIPFVDILSGSEPNDCHNFSQGMLVEMDEDGNSRITRLDFFGEKVIKEPWYLPAPDENKSQLIPYSEETRKANLPAKPVFPEGAKLVEKVKDPEAALPQYVIGFTAAKAEDMIESYRLRFVDDETGDVLKTVGIYSDFYQADRKEDMADELERSLTISKLAPFSFFGKGSYHLELVALDFDHQVSEPLCSPSYSRFDREPVDSFLNLPKDLKFGSFLRFSDLPLDKKLIHESEYTCWPPIERGDGASDLVITPNNGDRVVTMLLRTGVYQYYQFKRNLPADASGADQVWLWLDCSDAKFSRLYFSFVADGEIYSTDCCDGKDMKAYVKERGVWRAVPFNYDGCLGNFGGFKGYLRFPVEYLRNENGEVMPLNSIEAFRIGFSGNNDDLKDTAVSVGDIKFSKSPKKG